MINAVFSSATECTWQTDLLAALGHDCCGTCKRHLALLTVFAWIFTHDRGWVRFCSRHCLMCWLAAHPDPNEQEEAPE